MVNLSNLWIARSEQEQEFGAPVAVPFVCSKWSWANFELLPYKHIYNPSIIHSVDGFCDGLFCCASFTASIPLMLSMFGNMLAISNETRIVSLGNSFAFMLSIICSKCSVSLILASMLLAKGTQFFFWAWISFLLSYYNQLLLVLLGFPPCVFYIMLNSFPAELLSLLYNRAMLLLFLPCFSIYQPIL